MVHSYEKFYASVLYPYSLDSSNAWTLSCVPFICTVYCLINWRLVWLHIDILTVKDKARELA